MNVKDEAQAFLQKLVVDCCKMYSEQMQGKFENTKLYFEEDDLRKMHNSVKRESDARV